MESPFDTPERRAWEQSCLARARKGDRAAFAELYEAYAQPLFRRVLLPRLGNVQAAEDAMSETFRTLLEHADRIEDQGKSLWFWLARVAINKANDLHRAKGRSARALTNFESLLEPLREGPLDPAEAALEQDESSRARQAVELVLERLNPRYRRAIELRFLRDLSREQCAAELEVKIGTFDVLLLRALRAFRKEWELTSSKGTDARSEGEPKQRGAE